MAQLKNLRQSISLRSRSFGRSNDLWNATRLSHQTGGSENHRLRSAGSTSSPSGTGRYTTLQVVEEVMCHDTPFAQRRWLKTCVCRSESIGLRKMWIFCFQVKPKTRFRMYMESLCTYTNLPADVKPFMD